jgi:hypothetical protein
MTEKRVSAQSGFSASAEVIVGKKNIPTEPAEQLLNDPTEVPVGPAEQCIPLTRFKLSECSELEHFGLNHAIVTSETEEIVAAFGSASMAQIVLNLMNQEPNSMENPEAG